MSIKVVKNVLEDSAFLKTLRLSYNYAVKFSWRAKLFFAAAFFSIQSILSGQVLAQLLTKINKLCFLKLFHLGFS